MTNWPTELMDLVALHQEEEHVSNGVIVSMPLNEKASQDDLANCERAIGCRLDSQHREFLLHSNGWNGFSGNIDLFSTLDFLGGARFQKAQEWIKQMDRRVLGQYAKNRHLLFPIGRSSASTDLLLMLKGGDQVQPKVFWFTNELVEEFDSFEQMFTSFKTYAHSAIEYWKKRNAAV